MKIKELQEVRKETAEVLMNKVMTLKKELLKESLPSLGVEKLNLKKIRNTKKDISQLLTIIGEKGDNTGSKK